MTMTVKCIHFVIPITCYATKGDKGAVAAGYKYPPILIDRGHCLKLYKINKDIIMPPKPFPYVLPFSMTNSIILMSSGYIETRKPPGD
jgi:hypothetical protein